MSAKASLPSGDYRLEESLFPDLTIGEPKPWTTVYRGIEYRGEVLLTDSWRPELGEAIDKRDVHFRIVILAKPQAIPPGSISDQRIALCVPGKLTGRTKQIAVKEAREAYNLKESLTIKEAEFRKRLFREQASVYGAGKIHARTKLAITPKEVFSATTSEERLNLIVSALLTKAYSGLPINSSLLKKTLSSRDVGRIFDSLFGKVKPEARRTLEDFAVGLGLARADNPLKFNSEDCPVFPLLTAKLEEHYGYLPAQDLYQELGSTCGLIWSLISLYLLCLVRHGKPKIELRLKPGHQLTLRSGERVADDRLTSALIPEIRWREEIDGDFDSLCWVERLWSVAIPYACHIDENLKEVTQPSEIGDRETLLVDRLKELKINLDLVKGDLELLSTQLGMPPGEEVVATLGHLDSIAKNIKDCLGFYTTARQTYPTPDSLAEDMSLYRKLQQMHNICAEVLEVKAYLDGVILRESDAELAMDRVSILEQLNLKNLLPNPHYWPSIKTLFDWFKSRYRALYQAHHQEYHGEMASLSLALEDAEPEIKALKQLNSITELGSPLGTGLFDEYEQLVGKIRPCTAAEALVEEQLVCPHCGLLLTEQPPTSQVEQLIKRLHQSLKQQCRRLSTRAITQILDQKRTERIDRFIKVVQASDLYSLVDIMDDEMMDFIRALLRETHTESLRVVVELNREFQAVEEDNIDEVAAEFASLLRRALEKAKRKHPGKRIRIVLE